MLFKKLAKLFSPSTPTKQNRQPEDIPIGEILTATEFAKTLGLNVVECDADDDTNNNTIVSMSSGLTSIQSPRKSSYQNLDMNIFIPPQQYLMSKSANSHLQPLDIKYSNTMPMYKSKTQAVPRIRTNSLPVIEGPHSAHSHHISPLIEEAEVQRNGRFLTVTYSNSYYVSKQKKRAGSRFETTVLDIPIKRDRRFSDVGFVNNHPPSSL